MIEFNDLLKLSGFDPADVLIMRHRPFEPELRRVFAWIASERHDLFTTYQSSHFAKAESALKKAKYLAAFVGIEPGKAVFVCLYKVSGYADMTKEEFWQVAENRELRNHGMIGWSEDDSRKDVVRFNLNCSDFYESWRGKLVVSWTGLERSWYRWADRNSFPIHAISEESVLVKGMIRWDEINWSWNELAALPAKWRAKLSEWRGIYFIHDQSDGKGYVGSAYGIDNIGGRWQTYAKTGHGENKLLRERKHENFQFSILQIVPHDMLKDDVIRLESSWKERLHTRYPYGLNDN